MTTCHDVRRLAVCKACSGLGDRDSLPAGYHGSCYIAARGLEAFLALPTAELDKATLGDIGVDVMRRLLAQRRRRPPREPIIV